MMGKKHHGSDQRDCFQFIRMEPDQDRVVAIAAHNSINKKIKIIPQEMAANSI